jgi:predicted amidohydrolase
VVIGKESGLSFDGVGYGDSYVIDPFGEMMVRSQRHREDFIFADIDPVALESTKKGTARSLFSIREFRKHLLEAAGLEK